MGGVNRSADIEIDVGSLLKQQPADKGSTVASEAPVFVCLVVGKVVLCVGQHLVYGDDALRDKVNSLDLRRSAGSSLSLESSGLSLPACRDTCAAMDEVVPPQTMCLPSFEKKSDIIRLQSSRLEGGPKRMFIGSRLRIFTTQAVASSPGWPPYSLPHSSTSMVARVFAVYPAYAMPSMNRGNILTRCQPKLYAVPMPGVGTSVAHCDENIVFLQPYTRTEYLFSADVHLGHRVVKGAVIADEYHAGIIVLDKLRILVVR